MQTGGDDLRREIDRLREWRHDTAPVVVALERLYSELAATVREVNATVERMEREDEVTVRVRAARKADKGVVLSTAQKLVVLVLAVPAPLILVLQTFNVIQ